MAKLQKLVPLTERNLRAAMAQVGESPRYVLRVAGGRDEVAARRIVCDGERPVPGGVETVIAPVGRVTLEVAALPVGLWEVEPAASE